MNQLLDILSLEKSSRFLPPDVSSIIQQLIHVRESIFTSAARRFSTDYRWIEDDDAEEVSTQFYPNWPLLRLPKKYVVRNTTDADLCNKHYNRTNGLSFGIFSIGCSCSHNITLGFEINLNPESPHNLFRVLMCRDLDTENLKGVFYDNACNFHTYLLGREPREWEYLRCLVDGMHFRGHKKTKKGGHKSDGHLGCSNGYDGLAYKPHLHDHFNSEGREQIHSLLEKVSSSFRQTNFTSFMHLHRIFFGIRNLKSKGLI